MKKQFRLGFTLVELLVVISIIGMLAGLLLPAVNAAREAGRRAVCMNNQSQLALALINYDSAKGTLPPMRGIIGEKITAAATDTANAKANGSVTSWIGFLLPYMEFSQLYQNLADVSVNDTGGSHKHHEKQLIRIKSLLCPSSDAPMVDAGTHYICNGGYQNGLAASWAGTVTAGEPAKLPDAPFFDHLQVLLVGSGTTKMTCSIDYISSHSGTGNVMLLTENERTVDENFGARWAYWRKDNTGANDPWIGTVNNIDYTCHVWADGENRNASCYPIHIGIADAAAVKANASLTEAGTTLTNYSHNGYSTNDVSTTAVREYETPLFINVGRGIEFSDWSHYRRARPASNHPGIVLGAFADRSVRPLNENMNKQVFTWICMPHSQRVVGGGDF